jgi:hypothetical protein
MRLNTLIAACAATATATAIAAIAAAATPMAAAAGQSVVAGGCRVQANATVSPGLTLTSHAFQYHYRGKLDLRVYTGKGAAKAGTISAGEPINIHGHKYQEPAPTGTGTCLGTAAQGYDFAHWKNGTQTIVQFSTTSSNGGPTHLTGSVIPSLQLQAINPPAGAPKTITFKTTNFVGQNVVGLLTFKASDPALCGKPQGVTSATVTGVLGHVGLIGG